MATDEADVTARPQDEVKPLHIPWAAGELPKNWSWSRLDDCCVGVFDCPHSTPKLTDEGPLIARTQDILTGVFRVEQAAHVSEETFRERTARAVPSFGDLLYSREGTYFGIAAEVPPDAPVCLGQRMVLIRPRPNEVDFRFLRYWLNSPAMSAYIHGFRDGSVAERLNLPTIRGLPILLPSLPEQRAIAHVLGTLDEKIELNRQMNQTLEEMAAALFRSWFIDFDPVRAKMAGREPEGMAAATAALFPERLVASEVGEIPEGWQILCVREVAGVNSHTLGVKDTLAEVRYIDISSVSRGEVTEIKRFERGQEPSRARRKLRHGDTALSTVRPDRRAYFLAFDPADDLIASTGFAVVSPTRVPWSFLHLALVQPEIFAHLGRVADGGAYPAVRPHVIEEIELTVPNQGQLLESFHAIVSPLLTRMAANRAENTTLTQLRDTLLPRLLSGELRVPLELMDDIAQSPLDVVRV